MPKQKQTFQCYACKETFDLLIDIEEKPVITGCCPYCGVQWQVDLLPGGGIVEIFKSHQQHPAAHAAPVLPDTIVTIPRSPK